MIERLQAKRNEEGFTLIELLIVIIVLGILAAIVVFAVQGTKKDAIASTCKTDVKSIELSAESVLAKQFNGYTSIDQVTQANLYTEANGGLLRTDGVWPAKWADSKEYDLTWADRDAGAGVDMGVVVAGFGTPAETSCEDFES